MTAAAQGQMLQFETIRRAGMQLAAGQKVFKNTIACIDTSTGTVKQGTASTTLKPIGVFNEDLDNSAGGSSVEVDVNFIDEIVIVWWANGSSITAANIGSTAYILDNVTVTTVATGHSALGTILAIDPVKGVGVHQGAI